MKLFELGDIYLNLPKNDRKTERAGGFAYNGRTSVTRSSTEVKHKNVQLIYSFPRRAGFSRKFGNENHFFKVLETRARTEEPFLEIVTSMYPRA
jgi:hypothetical protein